MHEGITFKGTQLETKNKIELYNHFKSRIKPDTIEKITSQDATVFFTQLFQLRSPRILKQSLETITQILSNPPDNFKFDKGLKLNQSRVPMTAIYLLIYGICGNDTETGGILCKSIEDKKKPLKDSRVNCSLIELLCLCYENTTSNKKNLEEILNDCLNDKKTFATKISNHIFNFKFNYFKSSNSSSLETVSLEVKKQVMKFLGIEFTEQAPTCGNFQKFDFKTMIYLIKKIEYSSEVLPEHLIENWKNIAIKLCKAEYRGVYHNKRYNMLLATKVKQEYEAGVLESLKKTWFSNLNFIVDDTTVYESTCPWKMLNATTIINGCLSIQYPDRKRYKGIMDFFTPTAKLIYVTDSSGNWLARAFIQADFDNKTITVHLMKSKPGHKQPYEQIKKALELIIRKKAASLGSDWKIIDHTGN